MTNGSRSSIPTLDVRLPHAQLDAAVEHVHHRHRIGDTPVNAAHRHGAAASHALDRRMQRIKTIDAGLLDDLLGHRVRQLAGGFLR